jgi:glucose-6-phosphate-specific signal transduction histidine kinase
MIDTMTSARERIGKRDIAIASVLSVLGLALMYLNVRDPASEEELGMVRWGGLIPIEFALPLFLLVTVPLLWRRAAPIAAVGASFAGLVLNEVLIGTDVLRCGVVWPTALFFAFTAGAQLDGRDSRIGLTLAAGLTFVDFSVGFDPLTIAVATTVTVAMWGIARIARSRRRMANELRARTAELREARDERARMEIATDRARISRELDELLQRRLGELARMADEGARPSDEATATATLVDIERESRRTLEEMREVVGVLREESSQAPTTPQPTLIHLEAMLVRAKGAGARLAVEGSPRVLPAAVELSAYRIVEQLLTAIEDAPDVEVRVRFADDALELAVSGPARRRAKASIERARERARLQCGTLEATVRAGRAEAVASLPMLSAA